MGVAVFVLIVLVVGSYASLSVYKVYEYTSTPAQPPLSATPHGAGVAYQDVSFQSAGEDGVSLSGWWVSAPSASRVIVLVHGRYQNRSVFVPMLGPLVAHGYSVLAFDLRGHGASQESSCFYGVREQRDVVAAVEWVQARGFARESIAVVGWSLGATSALMAMPELPGLGAVVADSAYADDSLLLARNVLQPGLRLALRSVRGVDLASIRPEEDVSSSPTPLLVIHGSADAAVPADHAHRLVTAGPVSAELWIVADAGHLGAMGADPEGYIERIDEFLQKYLVRV